MLSPADHHRRVPRDPADNMVWGLEFLDAVEAAGEAGREAARRLCAEDLLFFVNCFGMQKNPKRQDGPKAGPFATFEFQERALRRMLANVERGRDTAVQKSRQIGASWMLAYLFAWLFLFHRWQSLHLVSRNADLVFGAADDSLFAKIDHILRYLPDWLLPEGLAKTKRLYVNPAQESSISGEATTERAGVGGTKTVVGIDEFAHIEQGFEVLQRTSDTTNARILNSTHMGTGTAFFKVIDEGLMDVVTMHWSEHPHYNKGLYRFDPDADPQKYPDRIIRLDPDYDYGDYPFVTDGLPTGGPYPGLRSPWYDEQCKRKGSARAVAVDLDIDPRGSVEQFMDAFLIGRLKTKDARPALWEGIVRHDRDTGEPVGLEPRPGGPLRLWVAPDLDGRPPPGVYVVAVDVSWGRGGTPSVAQIFRVLDGSIQHVGEFASAWVEPNPFGVMAVALCRLFRGRANPGAFLIWEISGPGAGFRDAVLGCGYRNIYYRTDDRKDPPERSELPGWNPSPTNKAHILDELQYAFKQGLCQVRSERVFEECKLFRHDGKGGVSHPRQKIRKEDGGPEASGAGEAHADYALPVALAWHAAQEVMGESMPEAEEQPVLAVSLAGRMRLAGDEDEPEGQWW